uniref:Ring finger protein 4 n=1 Tax=Fundulus heteroclitus TaxID=8078 RepID=A0A3Q2P960_FUNHE
MSSSAQRKRKPTGSSLPSRTKTSRTANSRTLALRTDGVGDPTPPSDPTDTLDSVTEGLEEVVDLTREGSEAAVVDLTTANDSVLLVDEGPLDIRVPPGQSYVLSSDDDEDGAIASHTARSTSGLVSCPICLDLYAEVRFCQLQTKVPISRPHSGFCWFLRVLLVPQGSAGSSGDMKTI